MGFGEKILSRFGYHKNPDIKFMSWKGDANSPAFSINLNTMPGIRTAYNTCSPVSSIVNRLASSMSVGQWWIVDNKNNDVSKQHATLWTLLQNPNPLQTRTELIKQVDLYRNLYGITHLYAVVPAGYNSAADATSLWAINPERITPVYKKDIIYFAQDAESIIEKYVITIGNSTIDVNPKHILTIDNSSLDVCTDDRQKNKSPLASLEYEIKNIIQAYQAIYSLNKDRGAQGILTNKTRDVSGSIPLSPDEKQQIQDEYQKLYGLRTDQAKVIISDSDLQFQQMTFNVKELMLFEGIKQNIESIADRLNYPFELLANEKGTTFANRAEAIKYLYQDNIIPAANLYQEKLTKFFELENAKIEIDFSHIEYLKQAEKERAEALLKLNHAWQIPYKLNVITREEYRRALDLDESPQGKTYYSPQNGKETTNES